LGVSDLAAYDAFLRSKVCLAPKAGVAFADADINPALKPHQQAAVRWALAGGRRAIFAAFGLGKSVMQLEITRLITERDGGRGLIVCPLGVRQEFVRDA
jgi:superfamily II DNA or RNA helicase